jgi:amidohydrolase
MRSLFAGTVLTLALGAPAAQAQAPSGPAQAPAQGAQTPAPLQAEIDRRAADVAARVVTWRRDFHQHPELGYQETRTAGIVADHLRKLGMEVRTGMAKTGVVGILRGGKPGRVVALRADMDALPVTEELDVPYASKVKAQWGGQEVGVMHACGHDAHTAMLMGAAEILAGVRDRLPGTVMFIFQPAEESIPGDELSGAERMVQEGVLDNPSPDAIFGLHTFPGPVGQIGYRAGGQMAAGNTLSITVTGKQTHGGMPWAGIDPIVVASQIVLGLQTIVSRQIDLTQAPAVISIGKISGGVRTNIIPESVLMEGTIRTFDPAMRSEVLRRVRQTAEHIAQAAGATATVKITDGYPVTLNDPDLTARMAPTLERVAGKGNARVVPPVMPSEDFSYYAQKVPALYFLLYVTPPGQDPATAPANHSPRYTVDERALPVGTRALAALAVDFLTK